jgi:hypothetical protein
MVKVAHVSIVITSINTGSTLDLISAPPPTWPSDVIRTTCRKYEVVAYRLEAWLIVGVKPR